MVRSEITHTQGKRGEETRGDPTVFSPSIFRPYDLTPSPPPEGRALLSERLEQTTIYKALGYCCLSLKAMVG